MTLENGEFIEVDFIGRVKGGEVFDATTKDALKNVNPNQPAKPFVYVLGKGMFLKGIDEHLVGKNLGKYTIELEPQDAFGLRDNALIQIMPMTVFHKQQVRPTPGAVFNFDGRMGRILSVSGGRVRVDFNNPMAGKAVIYEVDVKRHVKEKEEQVRAVCDFLFRDQLPFEVQEKEIVFVVNEQSKPLLEHFAPKLSELLEMPIKLQLKPLEKKERSTPEPEKKEVTKEKKEEAAPDKKESSEEPKEAPKTEEKKEETKEAEVKEEAPAKEETPVEEKTEESPAEEQKTEEKLIESTQAKEESKPQGEEAKPVEPEAPKDSEPTEQKEEVAKETPQEESKPEEKPAEEASEEKKEEPTEEEKADASKEEKKEAAPSQ